MKVLHLLDHSLPIQSGYAFRSHAILRAVNRLGISTRQLTSPKHSSSRGEAGLLDGLEYVRCRHVSGEDPISQLRCVLDARNGLRKLIDADRPDIIHAHSPCLNGLAAVGLGVPLIYEMRSSWEDAAVSSGKTEEGSLRYRLSRAMETRTVGWAHAVVVICDGLRAELLARGVSANKIVVVGNAIDPATLPQPDPDKIAALRQARGLQDRIVLGFFGSFFAWEGLDQLLRALPRVIEQVPELMLLLAGGGEQEEGLLAFVRENRLDNWVQFAGRVDHAEMGTYHGATDLMVFPRRGLRLTNMVTPLKPLEAMQLGTVVLASDVGGHRELIRHGETGFLFEADDLDAMASAIVGAIGARGSWDRIRQRARAYVAAERTWDRMAQRYERLYRRVARP